MYHMAGLLLGVFVSDILPIFLVAGVGLLLARRVGPTGASAVSGLIFNALAPCLVFDLLVTTPVDGREFGRMAFFCLLITAARGLAAWVVAWPLRLDRPALMGFLLVVMFSNGGNYGLPLTLFAFGREALAFATVYFVTGAVLTYTVGTLIAASGRASVREAVIGLARVPTVYALAAALMVLAADVSVPQAVLRPVGLLGGACVPMMLLVLGMQLASWRRPERPGAVAAATAVSLVLAPLLGLALADVVGLEGAARQAGVIQASMPAAVITMILALEFGAAPGFVASVVAVSTLVSPLTLTWLIAYLR